MQNNALLTWRNRVMSRYVRRDVRLVDGRELSVWAFPRGIRPEDSWSVSLMPDFVWAVLGVFEYLRYRIAYRGAWVIEIRNPRTDSALDERVYPSRATAMTSFERTRERLATQPFEHAGQALDGEDTWPPQG